jgi:phosphate-selective porin OprO/OprP
MRAFLATLTLLCCASTTAQGQQAEPEPAALRATETNPAAADPDSLIVEPLSATTTASEPAVNQRRLLDRLRDTTFRPARSLLIDREMPLVGIRWAGDLQGDVPLNHEPDGAQATLREAKLTFYRGFGTNWSAKVQSNYNNEGHFELGDTYLVFTGWKSSSATLGIFKPGYSLENLSSRVGLTFMERALPVAALSERRSSGLSILKRTESSILNAGLFLFNPDEAGQREKGQAVVLRYVHAPLDPVKGLGFGMLGGRGIWSGVSFSYRRNASGPNTQFRSLPEVGVTEDYFVDTGAIDGADSIIRLGLEASKVNGPWSWQAELLSTQVQREQQQSVLFYGGYFYLSWFLSGETRDYNPASGEFRNVIPRAPLGHHSWGAWELAARLSLVDLNDKDVVGGEQSNFTIGLNWYLNRYLRVQANLVKVLDVKRPGSEFDGQDPLIAALRLQWYLP